MKVKLVRNTKRVAEGFALMPKLVYKKFQDNIATELKIVSGKDVIIIEKDFFSKLVFAPAGEMISVQYDKALAAQEEFKKKNKKKKK